MSARRVHDLSYAKDLLWNLKGMGVHEFVLKDLHAQYVERAEDWHWRVEAMLDWEQMGRIRSEEERYA